MTFNKNYEQFMIGILYGIAWIILIFGVNKLIGFNNKEFGMVLILCGATGFYQMWVIDRLNSKNKKEKKHDITRKT